MHSVNWSRTQNTGASLSMLYIPKQHPTTHPIRIKPLLPAVHCPAPNLSCGPDQTRPAGLIVCDRPALGIPPLAGPAG